jgi:hypothetical protein
MAFGGRIVVRQTDVVLQEGGWDCGLGPRAFAAAQLNESMNGGLVRPPGRSRVFMSRK